MRDDFAKTLVERERIHSWDKYHNYRNKKGPSGLTDDEVGGRQSMRKPYNYNYGYDRKSFNENLNPLYGWVRSCLGKNWDKCYSELRKKFDARSVINQHILEHLWQVIETNTFVDEHGRSMARAGRYSLYGAVPVSECGSGYYVCPKSGMVREAHQKSKVAQKRLNEARRREELMQKERWLDKDNVLRLIDGTWYHFEMRDSPLLTFTYVKPAHATSFVCGSWGKKVTKTWGQMNQNERKEHGQRQLNGRPAIDVLTGAKVYRYEETATFGGRMGGQPRVLMHGEARYHATKKTANHRQLVAAGLTT